MIQKTFATVAVLLFIVGCSAPKSKPKAETEKLAQAYPAVFKKPDSSELMAQYKDQIYTTETIEKASKQLQDFAVRMQEFEAVVAYKTISEKQLAESDAPINVTFFIKKPDTDFAKLLPLVDMAEDKKIKLEFNPTPPEPKLVAIAGEKKYFQNDLDLNHTVYLDLKKKIFDEKLKQLSQVITYQEIKKAADAAGLTATQYLQQNNLGTGEPATDQEVRDYLKSINAQEEQIDDATFAKFKSILTQRNQDLKVRQFVADKLIGEPITIFLEKPEVELDVIREDTPFQGDKDSSVTMVLFTDMMCAHCLTLWSHIEKVKEQYGDGVRVGLHNFFISNDNFGRFAAEASQCMQKQSPSLFWKFVKNMQTETEAFSEQVINGSAESAGADMEAFRKCLRDRETKDIVDGEIEYAKSLGLQKVPTLIVSGKTFTGQASLDEILQVVKDNYVKTEKMGFFARLWHNIKSLFGGDA